MLDTRKAMLTAMLSAIAVILAVSFHVPIIPAAAYLEYDMADIPILFITLSLGIPYGLISTIVVSVLQGVAASASGIIGIIMHIFATSILVIVSGLIYKRFNSIIGLIAALVVGVIAWVVGMIIFNIIFTPIFLGTPRQAVIEMIVPITIPFNLIKAGANSVAGAILYLTLSPILSRFIPSTRLIKHGKKNTKAEQPPSIEIDCTTNSTAPINESDTTVELKTPINESDDTADAIKLINESDNTVEPTNPINESDNRKDN